MGPNCLYIFLGIHMGHPQWGWPTMSFRKKSDTWSHIWLSWNYYLTTPLLTILNRKNSTLSDGMQSTAFKALPISVSTILYLHSSHMKPLAAFQSTLLLCSVSLLLAITHYLPSICNLHPLLLCLMTSLQRCASPWSRSRIPTRSCPFSLSCFHRILLCNLFIPSSLTSYDEFLVCLWSL